jgi:hypothetical protein
MGIFKKRSGMRSRILQRGKSGLRGCLYYDEGKYLPEVAQ